MRQKPRKKSNIRFAKMLEFLQRKERAAATFTVSEIIKETGYKESSVTTYIGKRLLNYIVFKAGPDRYLAQGASRLSLEAFTRHMSQKSQFLVTHKQDLVARLFERSLDSYFLAIELYNRPTQRNRVEAFCILLINAWELLLKAEIVSVNGETAIRYPKYPNRTLSIRDLVKKQFNDGTDPVRKNIEFIADLRDDATHLILKELNASQSRLFQANILNFNRRYLQVTGETPLELQGPGLLSVVIEGDDANIAVIKKYYGMGTAIAVDGFLKRLKRTEGELKSTLFSIPIEYKLAFTKKEEGSDITLTVGQAGSEVAVVEVPKDANITHPYIQKDVIEKLKNKLSDEHAARINQFSVPAMLHKNKVRNSKSSHYYHYIEKPPTHKYSEKLIAMLIEKIEQNDGYIERCVESFKRYKRKIKALR